MVKQMTYCVLCCCLLLFGCQSAISSSNDTIDMALITKHNIGNYYQTMLRGAQTAETEISTVDVHFWPVTDTTDKEAQSILIDAAVAAQMEVILISPNGATSTNRALERAREAGVTIIVIDSPVELEGFTYVGTDNAHLGETMAQRLRENQLKAGQLMLIAPPDQSDNIQQRVEAIEQSYPDQSLVTVTLSYDIDEAVKQLERFKKMYPTVTHWVPVTEVMTEAAIRAVKLNSWQDNIHITGVDSNTAILQGLEQGVVERLFIQNSYAMGYLAVYAAYNTYRNIQSPQQQDTLYREVTKDNLFDEALAPILFPMEE